MEKIKRIYCGYDVLMALGNFTQNCLNTLHQVLIFENLFKIEC